MTVEALAVTCGLVILGVWTGVGMPKLYEVARKRLAASESSGW